MKANQISFECLDVAVREFNNWQGNAVLFIDFSDMTAWTDINNVPSYHSDLIIPLLGKDDLYGRNDKYSFESVNDLANKAHVKHKRGWTLDDFKLYFEHEFANEYRLGLM